MRIFNYDPSNGFFLSESEAQLCPGTEDLRRAAHARIAALVEERAANARAREVHAAQEEEVRKTWERAGMGEPVPTVLELPFPGADDEADPVIPDQVLLHPAHSTEIEPPTVTDPLKVASFDPRAQAWTVVRIPPEPVPRPASHEELRASWHELVVGVGDTLAMMVTASSAAAMEAFTASISGTAEKPVVDKKKRAEGDKHNAKAKMLVDVRRALFEVLNPKSFPKDGTVAEVDASIEARFAEVLKDADEEVRGVCEVLL